MNDLFGNKNRPRTCLDLRVGRFHLVECLFHLRHADLDWYHENEQDIQEELLELMTKSIIPRLFGDEIESFHAKRNPELFPPEKKIVSKNKKSTAASTANNTKNGKNKKSVASNINVNTNTNKRKRKAVPAKIAKAKAAAAIIVEDKDKKLPKDMYFSFGEIIQLAYRKQPLLDKSGATIFMKEGGFYDLRKLPSRLLIWVSKLDQQNKTNPDPAGVGFYRQEMVPIATLFREPKEEDDEGDD